MKDCTVCGAVGDEPCKPGCACDDCQLQQMFVLDVDPDGETEPDGEAPRGNEAACYERDCQAEIQETLK